MASSVGSLLVVCILALFLHGVKGEGSSSEELESRGLIVVKILCLMTMLVSTFACGVSPYLFRWNDTFLVLGTQFAGGVFLGTSLMHFLSDSDETFRELTTKSYPFAFMLASSGYLLTMLGDCVVNFVTANSQKKPKVVELEQGKTTPQPTDHCVVQTTNPVLFNTSSIGDTILLILALCFHSLFEGIAIGVAGTKAEAWKNLWTISLHKMFAAISMGIALLRMLPKRPLLTTAVYSMAFAVSSPIGVGIGIAIDTTTQGNTADWMFAITMGIASGVFVYVAINHLISKGFKQQGTTTPFDTPCFRFCFVLSGVAVIALVMIWD